MATNLKVLLEFHGCQNRAVFCAGTPRASVIGGQNITNGNNNSIAPKALPLIVCLTHANAIKQGAPV
jgi:hypothetical protein